VGTLFGYHSQTSVLIDQRCRPMIIISKCVSTHSVCGCRLTLPSALAYTRTHTLSHSLSLRMFVFFLFHIKTHLPQMSIIIEIQDWIVFGCSHFIGSTNTKLVSPDWDEKSLSRLKTKREKIKTSRKSFCQNFGVFYFS
jgi:hypothetical protein